MPETNDKIETHVRVAEPDSTPQVQSADQNSLTTTRDTLPPNPSAPIPKPITGTDKAVLAVLRANLGHVEALVTHELSLIGNRMVWFAISQSFLFGAYATIATDGARLGAIFSSATPPAMGSLTGKLLLLVVPAVGILFAIAAWISVHAANRVLSSLDPTRGELLIATNKILQNNGYIPLPVIGDQTQRATFSKRLGWTITLGQTPQWLLPLSMLLVWSGTILIRVPWLRLLSALEPK